jgi:hypothetical protein
MGLILVVTSDREHREGIDSRISRLSNRAILAPESMISAGYYHIHIFVLVLQP